MLTATINNTTYTKESEWTCFTYETLSKIRFRIKHPIRTELSEVKLLRDTIYKIICPHYPIHKELEIYLLGDTFELKRIGGVWEIINHYNNNHSNANHESIDHYLSN